MTNSAPLKVILHAPTPGSLERARNNSANLIQSSPNAMVQIIVNAQAVSSALDTENDQDVITWLCPNTLNRIQRSIRAPLQLLDNSAVLEIAWLQQAGWIYIRS